MNGGHSSRPCVSYASDPAWSVRFARDVAVWLAARDTLVETYRYPPAGGFRLLWLEPWDGSEALDLGVCAPFFIEVCRRVRVTAADGLLTARVGPSKVARLEARQMKGATGDVWTLLSIDGSALTVGATGFSYAKLQSLLFGPDWRPGAAQALVDDDGPAPVAIAQTLVRGRGKTEGWHERILAIPPSARPLLGTTEGRAQLGTMSKNRVEMAADVWRRVLRPALCVVEQGDPTSLDLRQDPADVWSRELDARIDAIFFEELWASIGKDPDEANATWQRLLVDMAADILQAAIRSTPLSAARRYRVISAAEGMFWGSAHKRFGNALRREKEVPEEDEQPS